MLALRGPHASRQAPRCWHIAPASRLWCSVSPPVHQFRRSVPVLGRRGSAELRHIMGSELHECSASPLCVHRGTDHDAYEARNAHLRRNHAPSSPPVHQFRRSVPVLGRGVTAELSHIIGSEHHECSAGPLCVHRGTDHDACEARNAHLRRNHAPSSPPVHQFRRSEPVLGWGVHWEGHLPF